MAEVCWVRCVSTTVAQLKHVIVLLNIAEACWLRLYYRLLVKSLRLATALGLY